MNIIEKIAKNNDFTFEKWTQKSGVSVYCFSFDNYDGSRRCADIFRKNKKLHTDFNYYSWSVQVMTKTDYNYNNDFENKSIFINNLFWYAMRKYNKNQYAARLAQISYCAKNPAYYPAYKAIYY